MTLNHSTQYEVFNTFTNNVKFFNEVVNKTLQKFRNNPNIDITQLGNELHIPINSVNIESIKMTRAIRETRILGFFNPSSDKFIRKYSTFIQLRINGQVQQIPRDCLNRSPIDISMYVRDAVLMAELKTLSTKLNDYNSEDSSLQLQLKTVEELIELRDGLKNQIAKEKEGVKNRIQELRNKVRLS